VYSIRSISIKDEFDKIIFSVDDDNLKLVCRPVFFSSARINKKPFAGIVVPDGKAHLLS
jgi:hypothetical protein